MKILESLSYDDLLLVPQYSEVISRNNVDLSGKISIHTTTLPIISSPMDTVSTSDMSIAMDKAGGFAIIHRNMPIEEQCREVAKAYESGAKIVSAAIGMNGDYLERAQQLFSICGCSILCVDVAHGDHILMKEALKKLKENLPGVYLIAGNVATASGFVNLSQWGADAIRCGVGGGCFTPGTMIKTFEGFQKIEEVKCGTHVLTHNNKYCKVTKTFSFYRKEKLLKINHKVRCTKNHKFYVLEKKYRSIVNDDNIHNYAIWVQARHLNKNKHLLLKLN